jgi:hypothetical protein
MRDDGDYIMTDKLPNADLHRESPPPPRRGGGGRAF